MKKLSDRILSLPRYFKRCIVIIADSTLCVICTWFAFILSLEEIILFQDINFFSALISITIAIPLLWLFGLYRTIFRYAGLSIIFSVLNSTFFYGSLYFLIIGVYGLEGVPLNIGIIQPMLLFFAIMASRLIAKYILIGNFSSKKNNNKKNIKDIFSSVKS